MQESIRKGELRRKGRAEEPIQQRHPLGSKAHKEALEWAAPIKRKKNQVENRIDEHKGSPNYLSSRKRPRYRLNVTNDELRDNRILLPC
eukprot:6209009-Pleurochrysis_carterae.AAC.1